jgi:hypothetical protein
MPRNSLTACFVLQSRAKDGQTTKDGHTVTGPPPASLLHAKGEETLEHLSHSSLKTCVRERGDQGREGGRTYEKDESLRESIYEQE